MATPGEVNSAITALDSNQAYLPMLVRSKFTLARNSGDLTYYPTQTHVLHCHGIPVSPNSLRLRRRGLEVSLTC